MNSANMSVYDVIAGQGFHVAGLSGRYAVAETVKIPDLWQRFVPYLDNIAVRVGEPHTTYGVCYNRSEAGLDYLCGVEVSPEADLPEIFTSIEIKPQTYAVFTHAGHISTLRTTWADIWQKWLPHSGLVVLPDPLFEKYGPSFDGQSGEGGLEIWIPVEP